jgi:hypothetical protein
MEFPPCAAALANLVGQLFPSLTTVSGLCPGNAHYTNNNQKSLLVLSVVTQL